MAGKFDSNKYVKDFERAFNENNLESVMHYYDPNVEIGDPNEPGKTMRGLDTFQQFMQQWADGFSDTKIEVVQAVQNGNDVAIFQRCKARHTGDFEIQPGERVSPTNKNVTIEIAEFIKLNDQGKIVRDLGIMDQLAFMRQLGLAPQAGGGAAEKRAVQR